MTTHHFNNRILDLNQISTKMDYKKRREMSLYSGELHWKKVLRVQQIKTETRSNCECGRKSKKRKHCEELADPDARPIGVFARVCARFRKLIRARRKYESLDESRHINQKPFLRGACPTETQHFYHKKLTKTESVNQIVKIEITTDDTNSIKERDCHSNKSNNKVSPKQRPVLQTLQLNKFSPKFDREGSPERRTLLSNQQDLKDVEEALQHHLGYEKKLSPLRVPTDGLTVKNPLTTTNSCPPKPSPVGSNEDLVGFKRLLMTWPIPGRKITTEDDFEDELLSESREFIEKLILQGRRSLEDFSIPYQSVEIIECLKQGARCKIYRGRWHGDVTVHVFQDKDDVTDTFWKNLTKLCRIRHENIILFMAACTKSPDLAVVTSYHRGTSLYEHIHIKHEKITMYDKVQILRQVALGMGYLHAKGIALKCLNSHNVFLCPKVKLSAMDWGIAESVHERSDYAIIPPHQLTYVAPEVLACVSVVPPRLVTTTTAYSKETDIFAFGTVMYEVFAGRYPYDDLNPMTLIWQVCGGRRQLLDKVRCTTPIKKMINSCWCQEPFHRPEFSHLSKSLLKNFPLHKRHSTSEPKKLHKLGRRMD
ncbi:hypothetical protein LOTGIDRAFT_228139 [Lottia gigantea]|uniref:Protein kinase domain-containing protein n=1 Tax=Lottia gigantea TaxID=225164 RepID=V4AN96_LOTGI|nr:hypothetical protein LOTGIDRAFT_228139 [Lottia gigantea]ESP05644.1 hypothetical protein LOTGIDRAFT_228139 [Lottia gigantea]